MNNNISEQSAKYDIKHKRMKRWQKVVSAMACFVVFCTTYALILPAITMSSQAFCGKEEHAHDDSCYQKQLVCGYGEDGGKVHTHSEECYSYTKELTCGQEEGGAYAYRCLLSGSGNESLRKGRTRP